MPSLSLPSLSLPSLRRRPAPRLLTPDIALAALVGLRGAVALGWFAPIRTAGAFGLRSAATEPSLPYFFRLFAARDGALALLSALAPKDFRQTVLTVGIVVDGSDAIAALIAGGSRRTPLLPALLAGGTAGAAVALGVRAASPR